MRRKSLTALAVLGCAVFLVSACASEQGAPNSGEGPEEPPAAAGVEGKGRVAIFDFEVKGGGGAYEALRSDIPGALAESFIEGGLLAPLERAALETALGEQALALSGLVDEATAARVGKIAGARYALLGSASIIGEQIRLSCRVVDIETAEILYASSAYGELEDIFGLLEELADQVQEGFSR